MKYLARVAFVVGLAGLTVGALCGPALFGAVSPTDGSVITTFSFPISIQLGGAASPGTLHVELNGQDITSQLSGGPTLYTATINPGAPLQDSNTLLVSAVIAVRMPRPLKPPLQLKIKKN